MTVRRKSYTNSYDYTTNNHLWGISAFTNNSILYGRLWEYLIRLLYYLPKGMKVERNRVWNKYTFTAEDKEDEKFLDKVNKKIDELEEENETLRDTNRDLQRWLKQTEDMLKFQQEENKKLREENEILRCSKGWTPEKVWHEEFIQYLMKENKKLKEENEILEEYKLMYEWLCN